MKMLIISASLNSDSNSRILAKEAVAASAGKADFVDLRDFPLPLCDGNTAYSDPNVAALAERIKNADCILVAAPVYNYSLNAALKNVIELTGSAWENKIVGLMCAAGGASSYMSVLSVANSLMLDFRCLIIPRFVYADGSAFSDDAISEKRIAERVHQLVAEGQRLGEALGQTKICA